MAEREKDGASTTVLELGEEAEAEAGEPRVALEDLAVGAPRPTGAALAPGMRTARLKEIRGRVAVLGLRGRAAPLEATIAPEVDPAVLEDAREAGASILVEVGEDGVPLVVGVVQTRRPQIIKLKASTIEIEGDKEVVLRSGRGALRIREDGDIELVGSRISAASRGLFRIVGRMLRLN